jgi:hypothetical protein
MENQFLEVAKKMDGIVLSSIGSEKLSGFEKAYRDAEGITALQLALTDQYMKPIMSLQGTKLGFVTDKDKSGGYPVETVRKCLIEAVFFGLQPTQNMFNIIAGNMYPTKEGLGYLLNKMPSLNYSIVCEITAFSKEKKSASANATIWWKLSGQQENTKVVPIPLKIDDYTSVDAVIGKSTRKARAWLLSRITGIEVTDGEVEDVSHIVVSSKPMEIVDKEAERISLMLSDCKTVEDVEALEENIKGHSELFSKRKSELVND